MSESLSLLLMDIDVLTLGRSRKVIPPPWYKGEESFWYAAAFRKGYTFSEEPFIFPKDEVYCIGGGAAGDLWRQQTWSPSWPPSWNYQ